MVHTEKIVILELMGYVPNPLSQVNIITWAISLLKTKNFYIMHSHINTFNMFTVWLSSCNMRRGVSQFLSVYANTDITIRDLYHSFLQQPPTCKHFLYSTPPSPKTIMFTKCLIVANCMYAYQIYIKAYLQILSLMHKYVSQYRNFCCCDTCISFSRHAGWLSDMLNRLS